MIENEDNIFINCQLHLDGNIYMLPVLCTTQITLGDLFRKMEEALLKNDPSINPADWQLSRFAIGGFSSECIDDYKQKPIDLIAKDFFSGTPFNSLENKNIVFYAANLANQNTNSNDRLMCRIM